MKIPRLLDMDKEVEGWEYETKCKRCGLLELRYVHKTLHVSYDNFKFAICEAIKYSMQFECNCCEKFTVQDIVAYDVS